MFEEQSEYTNLVHNNELIERPVDIQIRALQEQSLRNLEKEGLVTIETNEASEIARVIVDPQIFTEAYVQTTKGGVWLGDFHPRAVSDEWKKVS